MSLARYVAIPVSAIVLAIVLGLSLCLAITYQILFDR